MTRPGMAGSMSVWSMAVIGAPKSGTGYALRSFSASLNLTIRRIKSTGSGCERVDEGAHLTQRRLCLWWELGDVLVNRAGGRAGCWFV